MNGQREAVTSLLIGLVDAAKKDPATYVISSGEAGPEVSAWLRRVADARLVQQRELMETQARLAEARKLLERLVDMNDGPGFTDPNRDAPNTPEFENLLGDVAFYMDAPQ